MHLISWLCLRSTRRVLLPILVLGTTGTAASAEEPLDLPTLPGYNRAAPSDLNDRGQAVGQARRIGTNSPDLPVLWSKVGSAPDAIEALPVLDGMVGGDAGAISRSGIPVGSASIPGGFFKAVIWKKELGEWAAVELEPPPGYTHAIAADVSARGQVVGWAFNPGEMVGADIVRSAVVWQPSRGGDHTAVLLEAPEGFQSTATGINELGDIVGTAYRTEVGDSGSFLRSDVVVWRRMPRHHCRHRGGHPTSTQAPVILPSVEGLPSNTTPAINLFGHVVATAEGRTGAIRTMRPVFWKRRVWKWGGSPFEDPAVLPIPEGYTDGVARKINVTGRVVGSAVMRVGAALRASSAAVWRRDHRSGWTGEVLARFSRE